MSLDLSKRTVKDILRRTRDESESVRKMAYERLQQVDIGALTINTRVTLLKAGITDRINEVSNACSKLLLERWLPSRNNEIIEILKLLDVETSEEKHIEIILNHILQSNAQINIPKPPYNSENLNSELVLLILCF